MTSRGLSSGLGRALLFPALSVILVFWLGTGCGEQKEVILGALLTLTVDGQQAPDGADVSNGMLLAVEELNQNGGIKGSQVSLEILDTKSDPELARQLFVELEERAAPVVTYAAYSHITFALAELAEEAKAPLLAIVTSAEDLTKGRDWVFRYWPGVREHVKALQAIVGQLGLKDLAVVYVDTEYGRSLYDQLAAALKQQGVSVSGTPMGTGTVDFQTLLPSLLESEAILIIGLGNHFVAAYDTLQLLDYQGIKLATSTAAMPEMMALPSFQDVYIDAPQIYNPRLPYPSRVRKVYEERFGKPFSYFSAIGYDAVMLTAELLRGGETDRATFKQMFEQGFTFPGLFGDVSPEPGSHDMAFPLYPSRVKDGGLIYTGR